MQIASPACTELEVEMLNWLGKMIQLPAEFLASSGGKGGGVIQGTASEATLVALLGAKAKILQRVKAEHPEWDDNTIISKLVGYCSGEYSESARQTELSLNLMFSFAFAIYFASAQAHSSVERAGLLGGVRLRSLPADENQQLRGATVDAAIREDLAAGLIPFYVSQQPNQPAHAAVLFSIFGFYQFFRSSPLWAPPTLARLTVWRKSDQLPTTTMCGRMWTQPTPAQPSYVPNTVI